MLTAGRFADRIVMVTGSAQGIGRTVARRVAAEGGAVVLVDRSPLARDEAAEIETGGGRALAVLTDLETAEGAAAAVSAALDRFGRIDVLINNVGGTIWARPFQHYTADRIEAEIRRSLFPTLWMCHAVLPHLIEQRSGVIVNVSSVATRGINRVPYAAAKGGVGAITTALAMEVAQYGIRVAATAPGGTEAPPRRIARGPAPADDREAGWYDEVVSQTTSSSLLHRYGTLDEQAAAICFLASDEAGYITGTILPVAGGDLG
ncbi:1,6-dihydroxycyclohexa-2,4-diene-1-carboxylate dehydrogenase [Nocardia sp. NPDC058518]|uniref:1,6-dihydroxycyclohexa-2,4-diene-1-carboxylate dehydrogenase n=1 Tax=Nocardia sp. NPDC058518 TaxID=3346534 RepID=UPI00364C6212